MSKSRANIKTKKKYILLKISVALLILLVLLTSATYTWFEISKTPKVSDMTIFVNTNRGIELSWNPSDEKAWAQHLNFSDMHSGKTILKPVTYSYMQDCFYAARFGNDGRVESISNLLSDEKNSNRSDSKGYYIKFTFFARSDEKIMVSLLDAEQKTGTYVIGTPKWDEKSVLHENGGDGAEYAVRIGFRITPYDPKTNVFMEQNSRFIVYEPNCLDHENYKGNYIDQYIETPSMHTGQALVPKENLIRQTSTLWTEMNPIQMDKVDYKYGKFLDDTALFTLEKGEMVQIEAYLWLEGQDADCTNLIGHEASIFSSIQFFADVDYDSGMEDIE